MRLVLSIPRTDVKFGLMKRWFVGSLILIVLVATAVPGQWRRTAAPWQWRDLHSEALPAATLIAQDGEQSTWTGGAWRWRVRTIADDGQKDWNELLAQVHTIYQPQTHPYPGAITQKMTCVPSLLPHPLDTVPQALLLWANVNGALGACDEILATQRALVMIKLCSDGRHAFAIKLLTPRTVKKDHLVAVANSFSC